VHSGRFERSGVVLMDIEVSSEKTNLLLLLKSFV